MRFSIGCNIQQYIYILTLRGSVNMKAELRVLVPLDVVAYQFKPYAEVVFENLSSTNMENMI